MKRKYQRLIIGTIILFFVINAIPSVLGRTRQYYLTNFLFKTEIEGEGFSNAIESDSGISYEATAYALNILNNYSLKPHEIETLGTNLAGRIEEMFESDEVNIYELFYLMNSLKILSYNLDSGLLNKVYEYLNDTEQVSGGFSFSNSSKSTSLASTFYVIQLYSLIGQPIDNISTHKNWVLSCYNSDGGYGGNQSLTSTLSDTCFAVFILKELGEIEALNSVIKTIGYIQSFYVLNSGDLKNYGGYLPEEYANITLLSSTYYCVKAISIIDDSKLFKNTIKNWVLAHQNLIDGGFAENTEGYQQKASSVSACYFAFETLNTLNALSSLYSEIGMVQFNFWILTIIMGTIGLVVVVGIFLWRRRKI